MLRHCGRARRASDTTYIWPSQLDPPVPFNQATYHVVSPLALDQPLPVKCVIYRFNLFVRTRLTCNHLLALTKGGNLGLRRRIWALKWLLGVRKRDEEENGPEGRPSTHTGPLLYVR
jgi:hypothetical protein